MKKIIWCFVIGVCLYGCAPSTEIIGSWKNTQANPENLNSILVTALTSNTQARQTVENDLTRALQLNGYQAIKSMEVLPPTFTAGKEPDKEVLLDKIDGTGVDAILTVALLNKETENRYVPGNYGYEPIPRFGYYGRFWGYYNTWYPTLYSPGYYTEDEIYFLETNLYNAETEELLWSAQSETYNPGNLSGFSKDFASVVITKMEEDGVIKND
jgi:hypothetical protein